MVFYKPGGRQEESENLLFYCNTNILSEYSLQARWSLLQLYCRLATQGFVRRCSPICIDNKALSLLA
jgi:hypothetical protein